VVILEVKSAIVVVELNVHSGDGAETELHSRITHKPSSPTTVPLRLQEAARHCKTLSNSDRE
jgi:hypothetical protein